MRILITPLLVFLCSISLAQRNNNVNTYKLNQDFGKIIQDISDNYIYLKDKKTDFDCVKEKYSKIIPRIKTNQERVLFFEYLLDEFYDNNLILNTTTKTSFRLNSPFYITVKDDKFYIQNIWYSQIENFGKNIVGAQILNFNGKEFNKVIDEFPTQCVDKNLPEVREWIANKIISGRKHKLRILTLNLKDDRKISLDIDQLKVKKEKELLSVDKKNDIAIIRINNSLGNNNLIKHFDNQLNALLDTKGLVLDLRNTLNSGNSYVVKAILSRFIDKEMPFQKRVSKEKYGNNPEIVKSWVSYVNPRGVQYEKPIVVLVSRWTGSTGESIAIGIDGLERGKVVGTEMGKFEGEKVSFSFDSRSYGYTMSRDKIYHIKGVIREKFVPEFNITQESILKDDVLDKAISLFEIKETNNFVSEVETKNRIVSKID